ncbi:MAG: hypothetical protein ACD_79C00328G0005 [uncultured bacterium]|nr:MAG: hypothetical protein ACD_79C00328G0005 [uncultured bacterium]
MKTFKFIAYFLCFIFFHLVVNAESPSLYKPEKLKYDISFEVNNPSQNSFIDSKIKLAIDLIDNLVLFEQENGSRIPLQNFKFIFNIAFTNNKTPFTIQIFAVEKESLLIKTNRILEYSTINEKIKTIKFISIDKNETQGDSFSIINIKSDPNNNILERLLLRNSSLSITFMPEGFEKFVEGKFIEYKSYTSNNAPLQLITKTFTLAPNGEKRWIKIKETFNREYNEKGLLAKESETETTYSYTDSGPSSAIYNVIFSETGNIKNYDIVFSSDPENPQSLNLNNLNIISLKEDNIGPIEQLIREYQIKDKKQIFLKGEVLRKEKDSNGLVLFLKTSEFSIKPDTDGLKDEDKIFNKNIYIYNLEYNSSNQIVHKKIIKTSFVPAVTDKQKEIFDSLRNIYFTYDSQNTLNNIKVDFLEYTKAGKLEPAKTVSINVLENLPTGEPGKIELSVSSPTNPELNTKETMSQDCSYIIQEAINGEMFFEKSNMNFIPSIESISNKGDIDIKIEPGK